MFSSSKTVQKVFRRLKECMQRPSSNFHFASHLIAERHCRMITLLWLNILTPRIVNILFLLSHCLRNICFSMYMIYTMQEVLREAGIIASNTEKYPLRSIISAIEYAFHATPQLVCSGDAVEELRLCFYKDFNVRISVLG